MTMSNRSITHFRQDVPPKPSHRPYPIQTRSKRIRVPHLCPRCNESLIGDGLREGVGRSSQRVLWLTNCIACGALVEAVEEVGHVRISMHEGIGVSHGC